MSAGMHQRVVAVDTMTLIWGVRKDGPDEKIKYAGYLFKELDRDEAQIIIPSVVLCEYLTQVPNGDERDRTAAALSDRFHIAPFDARDAVLAAELWHDGKASRKMAQPGARACLRSDTFIVATAVTHGAREFYTEDEDCRSMASRHLNAKRLPRIASSLYEDTDR